MTLEEKFAILCHKIAFADGESSDAELAKVISVTRANDLNVDAVCEAWDDDCENPHDMIAVAKEVTDDNERDLIFFAMGRMAAADGILKIKELNRMFFVTDAWEWAPGYVVMMIARMLKKYPELQVEGVE